MGRPQENHNRGEIMGYLDTYRKITGDETPYITVRDRTITFSKTAVNALENSPFVCMYVDENRGRAAFQGCGNENGAIPFFREGRPAMVRIANKAKAKVILDMAGVESPGKGVKFYGIVIEDERLIDFVLR